MRRLENIHIFPRWELMMEHLVELEKKALQAMNLGDFTHAIKLYEEIVRENPQWEHGQAFYDLALCYENIGDLQKAEENYLRALEIQPKYYIFVGGYAEFLEQHGDPRAAFEFFAKLFRDGDAPDLDIIKSKLHILGARIGWKDDEVK
jgi:tetratricopeptide (TPR) repeat protein